MTMSLAEAAEKGGQLQCDMPQRQPHILICTPCHSGKVDINYHISLAMAGHYLAQHGVNYTLDYNVGMSIDWARSQMATKFLEESEFTHLLFIDDDIAFAADLPYRMLVEAVDVVAVPYRRKIRETRYNIRHGVRVKVMAQRPHMVAVESIATGMMMIRRNVFQTLEKRVPEFLYDNSGKKGRLFFHHQLVDDAMVGGVSYMGEDYNFCRIAREAGFDIWAYVDEPLAHIGPYAYDGNYVKVSDQTESGEKHNYLGKRLPLRVIYE